MSSKVDFNPKEPCVVCFKRVNTFSIGLCDHPVCFECGTRMRVLCQQNECPICRQEMPKVFFTKNVRPFNELKYLEWPLMDKKYQIYFDGPDIEAKYNKLLEHRCFLCSDTVFSNFKALSDHLARKHERWFCDLCSSNLKIFSKERKYYDRSHLSQHRRVGDPDDKSLKGHPLCEFCDVRYMDNDELYRHMRRDHYYCHFCDTDGHNYYFNEYPDLREHFLKEHFLCKEEDCVNEQFTSVFRTEIDLKAHVARNHGKTLGKYATKQARKVDVNIMYPARSAQRGRQESRFHPGEPSRGHRGEQPLVQQPPPPSSRPTEININIEEFPTLGGGAATIPVTPAQTSRKKRGGTENFPALGGSVDSRAPTAAASSGNAQWTATSRSHMMKSGPPPPSQHRPSSTTPSAAGSAPPSSNQQSTSSADAFPSLPSTLHPSRPLLTNSIFSSSSSSTPNSSTTPPPVTWNNVLTKKTTNNKEPTSKSKQLSKPSINDKTILSISKNVQNRSHLKTGPSSSGNSSSAAASGSVTGNGSGSLSVSSSSSSASLNKPKSVTNVSNNNSHKNKKFTSSNRPLNRHALYDDEEEKNCYDYYYSPEANGFVEKFLPRNHHGVVQPPMARVISAQPTSKVQLISQIPSSTAATVATQETSSSRLRNSHTLQNDMNVANILASSNNKKVKMKSKDRGGDDNDVVAPRRRINQDEFPSLGPAGYVSTAPSATSVPRKKASSQSGGGGGGGGNTTTTTTTSFNNNTNSYISPVNFSARNTLLFENIQKHIGPNFNEFKEMSMLFLRDSLSSVDYYQYCLKTLGRNVFNEIFPELLLLLPNIERQKDLWQVHHQNPSSKNKKIVAKLEQCATCGQIIHQTELKAHLDVHKRLAVPSTKKVTGGSAGGNAPPPPSSAWNKR